MEYLERLVDAELRRRLEVFPALMVVGPRACGKTTTASRLAASLVRLDRPATAAVFAADPDAALGDRAEPIVLDEWQDVAEVLGAVKRSVDADPHPGRFVLTGSVSAEFDAVSWPGTGRLVRMPMFGLTMRERLGLSSAGVNVAALLRGEVVLPGDRPNLVEYVDLALASGFPEAIRLGDPADRREWLDSYVDQLVTRDVARISAGRDPERLRRYLQAWALNSAGTADDVTIYGTVGIDRRTDIAYERVLRNTFAVVLVPAWTSNHLKRLVRSPKRYVVGPALMVPRRGWTPRCRRRLRPARTSDRDVRRRRTPGSTGGRGGSPYVLAPPHGRWPPRGRPDHRVRRRPCVRIEIKVTSAPRPDDARHLRWLASEIGDRFIGGVVFHTGPEPIRLGADIVALPICSRWGSNAS